MALEKRSAVTVQAVKDKYDAVVKAAYQNYHQNRFMKDNSFSNIKMLVTDGRDGSAFAAM